MFFITICAASDSGGMELKMTERLGMPRTEWPDSYVKSLAEDFLLRHSRNGRIATIYRIGSRVSGKAGEDSDWDYLVVGPGLDKAEDKRIKLAESGRPYPGLDIDVDVRRRHRHVDIIFSDVGPAPDQPSLAVYINPDAKPAKKAPRKITTRSSQTRGKSAPSGMGGLR